MRAQPSLDQMQFYLTSGVSLMPSLKRLYLKELMTLQAKGKVKLLPHVALQVFSDRVAQALTDDI